MLARSLLDLHASLQRQGVLFAFNGYLTDPLLVALGGVIKHRLSVEGVETGRARGLFAVYVEQAQNILRYSVDRCMADNVELAYGIVLIGREGDRYFVASGNPVAPAAVDHLRRQLTALAALDGAGLRRAYKQQLRAPPAAGSRGAGVGFVEMARRAVDGLHYDFLQPDAGSAFFAVKVSL